MLEGLDKQERSFYKRVEFVDKSGNVLYGKTTDEQVIMNSGKSLSAEFADVKNTTDWALDRISDIENNSIIYNDDENTFSLSISKYSSSYTSPIKGDMGSIPYGMDLYSNYECSVFVENLGGYKSNGQRLRLYSVNTYSSNRTLIGGTVVPFFDFGDNKVYSFYLSIAIDKTDNKVYYELNTSDYTGSFDLYLRNFKKIELP